MITLNDLNVGTSLTAYGVHYTVEITIPEQDYVIARLDNGQQVMHISSESLAMFPERYKLDITTKQSITGDSLGQVMENQENHEVLDLIEYSKALQAVARQVGTVRATNKAYDYYKAGELISFGNTSTLLPAMVEEYKRLFGIIN